MFFFYQKYSYVVRIQPQGNLSLVILEERKMERKNHFSTDFEKKATLIFDLIILVFFMHRVYEYSVYYLLLLGAKNVNCNA